MINKSRANLEKKAQDKKHVLNKRKFIITFGKLKDNKPTAK